MKAEKQRFFFEGTIEPPICATCLFLDGVNCFYFNQKRNTEPLSSFIKDKDCPAYTEDIVDEDEII